MSTTSYPAIPQPIDPRIVPQPPRLHWGVILALQIITLGLFSLVWLVVQAFWVKRMTGSSKGFTWAIVNLCALPVLFTFALLLGVVVAATHHTAEAGGVTNALETWYRLIFIVLNLGTVFTLKSEMDSYPIAMSLSGVMTFFFGTIYFQYHLHDYVLPDALEVYGPIPAAPAYVPTAPSQPAI